MIVRFVYVYVYKIKYEKSAANIAAAQAVGPLFIVGVVLTLLICNAAAGLAGRLAGCLAFAAASVLCALAKIAGLKRFNHFHSVPPY